MTKTINNDFYYGRSSNVLVDLLGIGVWNKHESDGNLRSDVFMGC
jgi:hypothetical protein